MFKVKIMYDIFNCSYYQIRLRKKFDIIHFNISGKSMLIH